MDVSAADCASSHHNKVVLNQIIFSLYDYQNHHSQSNHETFLLLFTQLQSGPLAARWDGVVFIRHPTATQRSSALASWSRSAMPAYSTKLTLVTRCRFNPSLFILASFCCVNDDPIIKIRGPSSSACMKGASVFYLKYLKLNSALKEKNFSERSDFTCHTHSKQMSFIISCDVFPHAAVSLGQFESP